MRRQAIEKHNEKLSPHTKDVFTFLKQLEEKKDKKKKKKHYKQNSTAY